MDRLIKIHGNEKLMARATAGTLRGLNGIGGFSYRLSVFFLIIGIL